MEDPNEPEEILCIAIVYRDGTECFEPMREYLRDPPAGTWVRRDSRRLPPEFVGAVRRERFKV